MTSVPQSVLDHIAAGRKIEAIKEVRSLTALGLREAKEAVEALERGESVSLPLQAPPLPSGRASEAADPNELATRVFSLVQDGRKIQAIKEVKEATGVGLAEAKQVVERVEAGQSLNGSPQQATSRRAALLVVVAAVLVALLSVVLTWLMAA